MNAKKLFALLVSASLMVGVFAGCGTAKSDATATPAATTDAKATAAPAAKEDQKIVINLGSEPPQLNSILTTDSTSGNVLRHIKEGLLKIDKDGKPVPGIAKEWKISDDKLTWTFTLRDAKWSDGTPVTAKDFEFAYKTVLDPASAAEYNYIMFNLKNGEAFANKKAKAEDVGVKAIDDKTLELKLERPTPYLPELLTFYPYLPVQEAAYKKNIQGDKNLNGTEVQYLLFNGPFIVKEWKHEDRIVLAKNPNYYDAANVKLEEITMLMIKDANTTLNKFLANEADMIGLKGDQLDAVKTAGFTPKNFTDGSTWYFEFNMADKTMANKNIRKALTYAIDRQTFVKGVLKNSSQPALTFTNPFIKGLNKSFSEELGQILKDNNADEAKKLLADGMKELGITTMPKVELLTDDSDVAKRDAAAHQQSWKKNLGLDVEVKTVPFKTRLELMKKKTFQIVNAGWGPDYNDPMTFLDMFETGNGNNHTSYSSKEYDALLAKIRAEADAAKRMDLLKQTEKLLLEDMPIGPIYFRVRDYVAKPYLKGIYRDALNDICLNYAYVEGKK